MFMCKNTIQIKQYMAALNRSDKRKTIYTVVEVNNSINSTVILVVT